MKHRASSSRRMDASDRHDGQSDKRTCLLVRLCLCWSLSLREFACDSVCSNDAYLLEKKKPQPVPTSVTHAPLPTQQFGVDLELWAIHVFLPLRILQYLDEGRWWQSCSWGAVFGVVCPWRDLVSEWIRVSGFQVFLVAVCYGHNATSHIPFSLLVI